MTLVDDFLDRARKYLRVSDGNYIQGDSKDLAVDVQSDGLYLLSKPNGVQDFTWLGPLNKENLGYHLADVVGLLEGDEEAFLADVQSVVVAEVKRLTGTEIALQRSTSGGLFEALSYKGVHVSISNPLRSASRIVRECMG